MDGKLRVATIGGIPIHVHVSWLAVYALITWTLAVGYFPRALPDLGPGVYWGGGLIAALLLFVSILIHELSHALVARAHGLGIHGITLHIFGGVSELRDEPPSPKAEFLIAVVGPVTSFAIAAVLAGITFAGVLTSPFAAAIAQYLLFVNAAVGVFNLIPGFPLDGGRLVRAALWRWTGSLGRATTVASQIGGAFAIGLMVLGGLQILAGSFVGGFWLVLIGLFLRSAATGSQARVVTQEALARLRVREVMTHDVVTVPVQASVADLVERFWEHHVTSFPVLDPTGVRGIATVHQVTQVPREAWTTTRVDTVMRQLDDSLTIGSDDSAFQALEKASRNGLGRLAVLDGPRLVGYLSLKDLTHVLTLRAAGRPPGAAAPPARRGWPRAA
jgi:Zn-dependent protease/CBS domain-containing protein